MHIGFQILFSNLVNKMTGTTLGKAVTAPEFGGSKKKTNKNRQSITISPLGIKFLTWFLNEDMIRIFRTFMTSQKLISALWKLS